MNPSQIPSFPHYHVCETTHKHHVFKDHDELKNWIIARQQGGQNNPIKISWCQPIQITEPPIDPPAPEDDSIPCRECGNPTDSEPRDSYPLCENCENWSWKLST